MSKRVGIFLSTFLLLCISPAASQEPAKAEAPPPPQFKPSPNDFIISPELDADRRLTFKLFAPNAKEVQVRGEWPTPGVPPGSGAAMQRQGEDGVWSVTIGPVPPGVYRYVYLVDGMQIADPRNPNASQSLNFVHSMVAVPGLDFQDVKDVPHGSVHTAYFRSQALGGELRRMHVYTPPGYEKDSRRSPVFYLLHGASDSDNSWSTVGHARFILDNLIAAGKARPMIVVMPMGHTRKLFWFGDPAPMQNFEFEKEFVQDVMPYVESLYRVLPGPQNRALAGLSMGGRQSLNIYLQHPEKFSYVGVFSSGFFLDKLEEVEQRYSAGLTDAKARKDLRLLWMAIGKDDFLLASSRSTVELLRKHGFKPEYVEGDGGHVWENWRAYLHQFAPRLFR